tara:strand:+ start:1255 stop:1437 length:183 start_codon:yes stop_codon:yes gene_type:complete
MRSICEYADWEWRPISMMPDGCNELSIKDKHGVVTDMCSCDFWWLSEEGRSVFVSFRGNE